MNSPITNKTKKEKAAEYYRGERISNALILFVGLGALTWVVLLYLIRRGMLSSGLLISTVPFAIFCIVSGFYRFRRSIGRFSLIKDEDLGDDYLNREEVLHLLGRSERFKRKRKVDSVGLIFGFVLLVVSVFFGLNHILIGTSISILIFSSLLLVFDLFGQYRTDEFLRQLQK